MKSMQYLWPVAYELLVLCRSINIQQRKILIEKGDEVQIAKVDNFQNWIFDLDRSK